MRNTADVTGGNPIAVLLQSISGVSAINPLVAFTTSMKEREMCYSFILSRTPHETLTKNNVQNKMVLKKGINWITDQQTINNDNHKCYGKHKSKLNSK
jgi:hypothetical protein